MNNNPEKLSEWLDHELKPSEVTLLETQLTQDAHLRDTFAAMQRVDLLLRRAAEEVVAPPPGFTRRFEARWAARQARKPWQTWLAVLALFLGSLGIGGSVAVTRGLTLIDTSNTVVSANTVHDAMGTLIESAAGVRTLLNLGLLLGKASLFVLSQPLFWLAIGLAIGATWLWIRVLQNLSQRATQPMELML